jgi:peptidoglycan/xylan/chitin deacetylase (PgdA/CDA1 family)
MKRYFRTPVLARMVYFRRSWGFSSKDKVYLTFDDGPTEELTLWILDMLKEHNIKATFFCVGANAKAHPHLMDKMIEEGHVIGNHTMRHENSNNTGSKEYMNSISEASEYIDSKLFRPPYGRLSMMRGIRILFKYRIIMWSWLSYDWDHEIDVPEILKNARKNIKGGDILVLHDNEKVTERLKELLPEIILIVKAKGYKFDVIGA